MYLLEDRSNASLVLNFCLFFDPNWNATFDEICVGSPQHIKIYTLRPQDLPEKGWVKVKQLSNMHPSLFIGTYYPGLCHNLEPNIFPSVPTTQSLSNTMIILNVCSFCFRTACEVSISHVDSPAHFFIHYKHTWDSLDALSAELNEFFQVN